MRVILRCDVISGKLEKKLRRGVKFEHHTICELLTILRECPLDKYNEIRKIALCLFCKYRHYKPTLKEMLKYF